MKRADEGTDELARWMAAWYTPAFKTACLVLGNATDAEEAVQEAFLRMWRFRASMPEGEAARPWLFRVVVNACYSFARKEQRIQRHLQPGSVDDLVDDNAAGPDVSAIVSERAGAIRSALARLPEQLRVAVVLCYYAGLSEREIALAIHRRPGTVKSRLHEARQVLASDPALAALVDRREETK